MALTAPPAPRPSGTHRVPRAHRTADPRRPRCPHQSRRALNAAPSDILFAIASSVVLLLCAFVAGALAAHPF